MCSLWGKTVSSTLHVFSWRALGQMSPRKVSLRANTPGREVSPHHQHLCRVEVTKSTWSQAARIHSERSCGWTQELSGAPRFPRRRQPAKDVEGLARVMRNGTPGEHSVMEATSTGFQEKGNNQQGRIYQKRATSINQKESGDPDYYEVINQVSKTNVAEM